MDAETYRIEKSILGFFIIGSSIGFGAAFCIGICLISWLRKKRREKNKKLLPLSLKCIQKQHKTKSPEFLPQQPPAILFFPSISNSEPGSDTCSQKSTLSATSPLTTEGAKSFKTFIDYHHRAHETLRQNSSYWRDKIPFFTPKERRYPRSDRARRRSLSPNPKPRFKDTEFPQTWTASIKVEGAVHMSVPVSKSCHSLDDVIKDERNVLIVEDNTKYKIGKIRLRIKHSKSTAKLFVGLFHQISLPAIMKLKYTEMYVKFSLIGKDVRLKKLVPLQIGTRNSPFCAVFCCDITSDTLIHAILNISLCKKGDYSSQRVVVGTASVSFTEMITSMDEAENFEKEFDTDILESSTRHKVDCDGVLSFDISYDTCSNSVLLLNVIFQEFEARKISRENDNRQYSEIYLKAMAYKGSNALCWRRGSSVFVEPTDSSVSLASLMCLPTSMPDFKDITLVLMIKQKFVTRGRRNLLGKLFLNMDSLLTDETIKQKAAAGKFWKKSIKLSLEN